MHRGSGSNLKDATPIPPPRRRKRNKGRPLPPKPDEVSAENSSNGLDRTETGNEPLYSSVRSPKSSGDEQEAEEKTRSYEEGGKRTKEIYEHKASIRCRFTAIRQTVSLLRPLERFENLFRSYTEHFGIAGERNRKSDLERRGFREKVLRERRCAAAVRKIRQRPHEQRFLHSEARGEEKMEARGEARGGSVEEGGEMERQREVQALEHRQPAELRRVGYEETSIEGNGAPTGRIRVPSEETRQEQHRVASARILPLPIFRGTQPFSYRSLPSGSFPRKRQI